MEARELGRSGISVSRVILGCGNFGGVGSAPAFFGQGIPHDEALRIMDAAWELGITTFDTADAYGGGRSETWIGEWLATKGSAVRDAITIETKTFNPVSEGADRGLARRRILRQIDASLQRLGLERIPLYMAHDHDPDTPVEETLAAFDELVRAGKVGASAPPTSRPSSSPRRRALGARRARALRVGPELVLAPRARRRRDRCSRCATSTASGYEAFGPLAGGWLAGRYRRGESYPEGSRMTQRPDGYRRYESDAMFDSLEAFEREALARGVSMAGLAVAWLLGVPDVTAVVVGPTRAEQLEPVREALALELTRDEHAHLRGLFA